MAERIECHVNYGAFLLQSLNFSNPFINSLIKDLTINDYQTKSANINELINSFDRICRSYEIEPQLLISNFIRWKTPELTKSSIDSIPLLFFAEIVKSNERMALDFISYLNDYYKGLSKEEWLNIFVDMSDKKFKLINTIEFQGWNSHSLEALKETLLSRVKSGQTEYGIELNALLMSFEKSELDLSNTFKNIRDEFISLRNMNIQLFSTFENWLFKYSSLEEKAGDVLRTILIPSLLDNELILSKLVKNKESIKQIIDRCSSNDVFDFKEALRDRFDNEVIKEFAKFLGVRERKIKDDTNIEKKITIV